MCHIIQLHTYYIYISIVVGKVFVRNGVGERPNRLVFAIDTKEIGLSAERARAVDFPFSFIENNQCRTYLALSLIFDQKYTPVYANDHAFFSPRAN